MKVKEIETSCHNGEYAEYSYSGDLGAFPWLARLFGLANVPLLQAVYSE